ncbi:hypothetical protein [Herbiconiux sp. A18JL235]|uniref:Helix-turn-helix domain-containing protein n=1 Tax=Herbiconiux sp. A18JL235 TaxID=3152363 RepID=A0AB39BN73_9MICO
MPAWASGAAWFDAVMDALRTPEGEQLRRRVKVAPDTLLRIAHADMLAADADTGRGVSTAHETVAEVTGVCKKTVQRARGLLEALGLAVSIVEGRYLTVAEREAAESAHGGRQIKAASVRALTMPKRWAVENVHLPRRGDLGIKAPDLEVKPTRASARESAASRPPAKTKGSTRPGFPRSGQPRPLGVQRFAAGLVARMRWLADGRHIGQVCAMLERTGVDPDRWTIDAFMDALATGNKHAGFTVAEPSGQRDPVAYLGWQIKNAIDPNEPTPAEEAQLRAIQARAELEARRREREAEEARWASRDQAAIDEAIVAMHEQQKAWERARRHPNEETE